MIILSQSECTENNRNILKITSVEPTNSCFTDKIAMHQNEHATSISGKLLENHPDFFFNIPGASEGNYADPSRKLPMKKCLSSFKVN